IIFGDVIEFPVVVAQRGHRGSQHPGCYWRCRGGNPTVMVNRAVADHLEILRLMFRGRVWSRSRGIERVSHAHAFDWLLRNAVDLLGRLDARGLKEARPDVNEVLRLGADADDMP